MSFHPNLITSKKALLIALNLILVCSFIKPNQNISTNTLEFLAENEANEIQDYISKSTLNSKPNEENLTKTLLFLYSKISETQSKSDKSFRKFPPQNAEIKGLFSSYIHLNFIDNENSQISNLFRNKLKALDMNMFVTNFVLCSLLEALPYTTAFLDENVQKAHLQSMIANALEALSEFRDKNYAANIPVYNFWRQQLVNGTWSQSPETMLNLIKIAPKFPKFFIEFLKKVKLGNVAGFLETLEFMTQIFMYAFRIPPDADDSSVNMALTGLLHKMEGELIEIENFNISKKKFNEKEEKAENYFENLWNKINEFFVIEKNNKNEKANFMNLRNETNLNKKLKNKKKENLKKEEFDFNKKLGEWFKSNSDYKSFLNTLKAKAYRPFLNSNFTFVKNLTEVSETADLIDPRTYFVIRKFLQQKFSEQKDLILPTTWLHDIKDEQNESPLVTMPFRVNNIDFNVLTNFLYGTTNLILNHPDKNYITKIFDSQMLQMYSDTVDLLVFAIKEDILSWRPDLALLYYPSVFDFYWLISRVYATLKNSHIQLDAFKCINGNADCKEPVLDVLKASEIKLENVLKNDLTQQMAKRLLKNQEENDEFFFVEFLGNTEKTKRNQDSLFATALGLNAYMNIWTKEFSAEKLKKMNITNINFSENKNNKKLIFDDDTSPEIRTIIENLANYIIKNAGEKSASFEGAFFSGSVKSENSNAYFFPGNYYKFLNGTDLKDHTKPDSAQLTLSFGVKGFVTENEYEELLKGVYFGKAPPVDFEPYTMNIFPFWSSPAMTMSVNYLALCKYRSLIR